METVKLPRLIPVGKHDWALVDEENYEGLSNRTWHLDRHNYAVTNAKKSDGVGRTSFYMHRMVLKPEPGLVTDHRNSNTLDNRRSNLRACRQSENTANRGKGRKIETSSRFKGVWYRKDRDRWSAYIGGGSLYRRNWLGCYATEEEAARAYNEAAKALYGEFAQLNDV